MYLVTINCDVGTPRGLFGSFKVLLPSFPSSGNVSQQQQQWSSILLRGSS